MEIKICCLIAENGVRDVTKQSGTTYLFEGTNIQHSFILLSSRDEFIKEIGEDYTRAIGMPEWFYDKTKEFDPGHYVRLTFTDLGTENWMCMIIKNSTVFITSNGRTIDKIEIR